MRPSKEPEFAFEHGEYWYYRYGVQYYKDGKLDAGHPHRVGKEVAILIHVGDPDDDSSIYLAKHGSPENVQAFHAKLLESLVNYRDDEFCPTHIYIAGQFSTESLNALLGNGAAVKRFLKSNGLALSHTPGQNNVSITDYKEAEPETVKRSMRF